MTTPPRFTLLSSVAAAALLALTLAAGCDRLRLEEQGSSAPEPVVQPDALRSLVSPDGLARLYQTQYPQGLPLEADATETTIDGSPVSVGPLRQSLPFQQWTTAVDDGVLRFELRSDTPSVVIPVRIPREIGVRICRFRLRADRWDVSVRTANRAEDGWRLETIAPPNFETMSPRIAAVGDCPELLDKPGKLPDSLEQAVTDFLDEAIAGGIRQVIAASPFDALGLLRQDIDLVRLAPFANRRGTLRLLGRFPETEAISLGDGGLEADLNLGISARRADCAPPDGLELPQNRPAGRIDASTLEAAGADVGLAIAGPLLRRLARASTLGGFLCRGLESDDATLDGMALTVDDARLSMIDLETIPAAGDLEVALSPGRLPELNTRPDANALELSFTDLGLELYGPVRGVRTRLVELTVTATFTLRPDIQSADRLALTLNAVSVDNASLQTPWSDALPDDGALSRWTRRLLLLVFEDAFTLPLPIRPAAPLQAVRAHVRGDDVLLLLNVLER